MNIEIVKTSTEWQEKGKNKWQKLNVVFKNFDKGGEIDGRNLLSFTNEAAFKALKEAQRGETWELEEVTNAKGYPEVTGAKKVSNDATPANVTASASKNTPTPKSTYETAEERAARQVLIVRQSSLANAIAYHAGPVGEDILLATATKFSDWVFQKSDPIKAIKDMADDIPEA